jgi:phage major head subunit gpT-like protein
LTMVRNQFFQAMSVDVAHNFIEFLDLRQKAVQFRSIFNVHPSRKAYEDAVHYAGFGPAQPKNEGEAVVYDNLVQGGTRRYVHQTYGLGVRMSYELMQDDQTGMMEQSPKGLVQAHIFAQEMTAANVFNLGFSATGTLTDDGVSLFNNQHPLLGGVAATNVAPGVGSFSTAAGTYPNRPAVDADLSFTALQYATMTFQRMPNARGLVVAVRPKHLRIPPELEFIAIELLGSAGKPYTSDNEVNALLSTGLSYELNSYFTSPSEWFLTGNKDEHRLMFFERQPIYGDYDRDFDQQALKFLAIARYSAGADTWLNTFGSLGP